MPEVGHVVIAPGARLHPLSKSELEAKLVALSARQRALYLAIRTYIDENAAPPTLQEMAAMIGVYKSTVQHHLSRLERAGLIVRIPRQSRGVKVAPVVPDAPERVAVGA